MKKCWWRNKVIEKIPLSGCLDASSDLTNHSFSLHWTMKLKVRSCHLLWQDQFLLNKAREGLDTRELFFTYFRKKALRGSCCSPVLHAEVDTVSFSYKAQLRTWLSVLCMPTRHEVTSAAFWEASGTDSSPDKLSCKTSCKSFIIGGKALCLTRIGPMHIPGWGCEGLQKVFMWVHSCSLGKCSIPGQQNSAV